MNRFTVDLQTRSFTEYTPSNNMKFTPKRWSANDQGGPQDAEILLTGPTGSLIEALDWLRYPVKIRNRQGTAVWWGYIATLDGKLDQLTFSVTLDELRNRIRIIYSYQGPDGAALSGETAWASDSNSISEYGAWETVKSIGEATAERAAQELINELADYGNPNTSEFSMGGADPNARGEITLNCRGWWYTLGAKYFGRPDGVEKHATGDTKQISMGQRFAGNTIGFEDNNDYIHEVNGAFGEFESGQRVKVSGANNAANNGTFKIVRGTDQQPLTIISASIYFDPSDDIHIPGTGFADIDANDLISISGAAQGANNGYFWTQEVASSNHIVTTTHTIVAGSPGPTITLRRGHGIGVDGGLVKELPGASVTLTVVGEVMGQRFILTEAVGFSVFEVYVRVGKINAVGDGVTVQIYTDGGGLPGSLLESATVAAANIPTGPDWVKFVFAGTTAISPGVAYWIVVRRSGASDYGNYYSVEIDQDGGYAGSLKLWDGTAWVDPETPGDMYFAVWGKEPTTTQIQKMVTSGGQFIQSCQIIDASGLNTYQYRDGELKAREEIEALLRAGTSAGKRLVAEVTEQRYIMISKRPDVTGQDGMVMVDLKGRWTDIFGSKLDDGYLPVGRWVEIKGLPPDVNAATRISPFYVGFAEYDAKSGELHCERNADRAIGDISSVSN